MKKYFLFLFTVSLLIPFQLFAEQESVLINDNQGIFNARVEKIIGTKTESFPNSSTGVIVQDISARITSGIFEGQTVSITNDVSPMKVGDKFWGQWITTEGGTTLFAVSDFERRPALLGLVILFVLVILLLGRLQGLRSLGSLALSILAIVFILIPLLLKGYPPVLVTVLVGSLVLFCAIILTHGWNRISWIAFSSTIISVVITSVLAQLVTKWSHITGFASHEAIYLNFNTGGELDFVGIFLASIIIGMLGVLDDISVTQVAVVRELYAVGSHIKQSEIFTRALRVGKEHVSALVNTLVLAYVGVALPLVLFYSSGDVNVGHTINSEIFASEIIRTILGSLGLVMTVPLSTWLAVVFLKDTRGKKLTEDEKIHAHSHGHDHNH
jgi:uncharacterized membrane protein